MLAIAGEVERINNANLEDQRAEVAQRERELRQYLDGLLWRSLALGLFAALAAVIRILILERRSERQRERTERAEGELRRLSHQLVRAQEDERRRLSRELHDEIGQTLTALRIELHRAERAPALSAPTFVAAVAECRRLIDQVTHAARDLAMGLRPNMLDDLGLEPALSWHTQDFSRRYKVPVDLSVSGDLQELPEPHRTCLYRVVQEALTNCARHARATRVSVIVERKGDRISLSVLDDGVGMDLRRQHEGLGLIGIEERLRELGGTMAIRSAPGEGTVLVMWLPVPAGQREAAGAHSGC
ncbi:MAG TPA: sensor histidine kinase [Vicinamibacterales bacterium]|nr:sensor histidine kinase [Vicinamibacterales bacterium]